MGFGSPCTSTLVHGVRSRLRSCAGVRAGVGAVNRRRCGCWEGAAPGPGVFLPPGGLPKFPPRRLFAPTRPPSQHPKVPPILGLGGTAKGRSDRSAILGRRAGVRLSPTGRPRIAERSRAPKMQDAACRRAGARTNCNRHKGEVSWSRRAGARPSCHTHRCAKIGKTRRWRRHKAKVYV